MGFLHPALKLNVFFFVKRSQRTIELFFGPMRDFSMTHCPAMTEYMADFVNMGRKPRFHCIDKEYAGTTGTHEK